MGALSIRLPDDTVEKLDNLAEQTKRSRTFLVREAIEAYLQEYGDYRVGLDRLLDKNDEIVDSKELRRRLGL